ncbi:MAG: hypothetical protein AMJ42_04375 [Deltaproteobacteria bacterium DG_8]|nr:MAG: hypothetical protein AMJ42_04375 [Deltaproteobacteria bacterium DG_8]
MLLSYSIEDTLYLKNSLPYVVDFFVFTLISVSVYGIGFLIYRILKLDCPTKMEEIVYCCAFGIGLTAYLILGVGLLGLLYKKVFYLIFILLTVFLAPYIYKNRSVFLKRKKENVSSSKFDRYWNLILCSILFFLFANSFINALAPVTDYDSMVDHYGLPNIFIQEHRICYLPENVLSAYPLTMEMLFTLGSLLRGYEVSNLIQYGVSVLFLLSIFIFTRRYFDHQTALLTSVLLFSTPLIVHTFSRPGADMGLALFNCLGLFSLITWFEARKDRWLISSAIFTGFALGTKYTALFFCLGLLGLMLFGRLLLGNHKQKKNFSKVCIFFLVSIAVASPWYIKNWITTGNPLFPAFYNIFGGDDYSYAMALRHLKDAHHPEISLSSIKDFVIIPYRLFADPYLYGVPIGPFFIFFWPFMLLLRKGHTIIKYLIIFVFAYFTLWAFSFQQTRYMISAIGASAILGGFVFEELRRARERCLCYFSVFFIIMVMTCNICIFLSRSRIALDPFPVVFGVVSKSDYLKKYLSIAYGNRFYDFKALYNKQNVQNEYGDVFTVFEYANQNLKSTDKILFLGETMHAYLKKKYVCNSAFNKNILIHMLHNKISDEKILERLSSMGITHILFNVDELKRLNIQGYSYQLSANDIKHLKEFLYKRTFVEFRNGNVLLLKLNTLSGLSMRH